MTNEMKLLHKFPEGEAVINMATNENGTIVICTNKGVYILSKDNELTEVIIDEQHR